MLNEDLFSTYKLKLKVKGQKKKKKPAAFKNILMSLEQWVPNYTAPESHTWGPDNRPAAQKPPVDTLVS